MTWRTRRSSRKYRLRDLRYWLTCKYCSGLGPRAISVSSVHLPAVQPSTHTPLCGCGLLIVPHLSPSLPPSHLPLFGHTIPQTTFPFPCPPHPSFHVHRPSLAHPSLPFHVVFFCTVFSLSSPFFSELDPSVCLSCYLLIQFCPSPSTHSSTYAPRTDFEQEFILYPACGA